MALFGSDYAQRFGLPPYPWQDIAHNQMFGPGFSGMNNGQPVPGVAAPVGGDPIQMADAGIGGIGAPTMRSSAPDAGLGPSANPSVDALRSGNPLAVGAGLPSVGNNSLAAGAGASPQPGAGASALTFAGAGGRGV